MPRTSGGSKVPSSAAWSNCQRWEAFTTDTSELRHEAAQGVAPQPKGKTELDGAFGKDSAKRARQGSPVSDPSWDSHRV